MLRVSTGGSESTGSSSCHSNTLKSVGVVSMRRFAAPFRSKTASTSAIVLLRLAILHPCWALVLTEGRVSSSLSACLRLKKANSQPPFPLAYRCWVKYCVLLNIRLHELHHTRVIIQQYAYFFVSLGCCVLLERTVSPLTHARALLLKK